MCNGDNTEPEIAVNSVDLPSKVLSSITNKFKRAKKGCSVMLKKSKYDDYLAECKLKKTKFVDK